MGPCLAAAVSCTPSGNTDARPGPQVTKVESVLNLVLVPEGQPWLTAVAVPVVGKLRTDAGPPWLLATSNPPQRETLDLVQRIAPKRVLALAQPADTGPVFGLSSVQRMLEPDTIPQAASLTLAKEFWQTAPEVVVASSADPEGIIQGSTLAAHRAVPLLVWEAEQERLFAEGLDELRVEQVLLIAERSGEQPAWAKSRKRTVEVLDHKEIERRAIVLLDPAQIRNMILARTPQHQETREVGPTAWLAPYLSLVHRAPVVLCRSASAAKAEAEIDDAIARHALRPRTLTILADYRSIGTNKAVLDPGEDPTAPNGEVRVEPCLPTTFTRPAMMGVGRIPFSTLEEASTLFVRGLVRERLLAGQSPRAVVIANPASDTMPLPLCEAIARVTAAELQNRGIRTDEFYRSPADGPDVLTAMKTAHLVMYQGHTEQQDLFGRRRGQRSNEPLDGLPVVVLQTCESLRERVFDDVHEAGGAALIGTVTRVHSTSGSALIKAMVDGVLYRGETLGEAFCDARNYFLCLQDLKGLRDHQQQAKSQRVALSFRLWGDPELRIFPQPLSAPRLAPVAASWNGKGQILIAAPQSRLPEARNDQYSVRIFPGSEAAGLVKEIDRDEARQLTPLYFFRLPLPQGFSTRENRRLEHSGDKTDRAVYRVDPLGRFLYVLYYPALERPGKTFTLRFTEPLERPER